MRLVYCIMQTIIEKLAEELKVGPVLLEGALQTLIEAERERQKKLPGWEKEG